MNRHCLAAALLALLGCGTPERVTLPAVHQAHDPAVRAQVNGLERQIRALEDGNADDAVLGAAVGELGRLYHGVQLLDSHAFTALEAAEASYGEARRLDPTDHRWPYLLGFAAETRGDHEAAATSYRAALAIEPDLVPAIQRLARSEVERGRPDEAAALWNRALELRPGFPPALYGLGSLSLEGGDAETAADFLERAVAAEPGAGRGHYSLAMAWRLLGDEDRAARHFAQASHSDFPFEDPLIGELAYLPAGSAALVQQGLIAVQAGEFAAAATVFARAIEADPTNLEAHRHLALAHVDAGQFEQAEAAYEELLALAPDQATAHFELAQLLSNRGQAAEAIRHLTRAIGLAPDYKQAHYQLALLLDRAGRPAEALERYDRVLALDPDYAEAGTRRAAAIAAVGRPTEALELLRGRVDDVPSDAAAVQALSVVLRQQNRLQEARAALERSLRSADFTAADEARLRTELGGILAIEGRLPDAARELQTAQQLDPTEPQTSFVLGMVLLDLRRPEEAARAFAATLALRPDFTMARLRLAAILAQTDRCEETLALLDDGRRFATTDPMFAQASQQLRSACAEH